MEFITRIFRTPAFLDRSEIELSALASLSLRHNFAMNAKACNAAIRMNFQPHVCEAAPMLMGRAMNLSCMIGALPVLTLASIGAASAAPRTQE